MNELQIPEVYFEREPSLSCKVSQHEKGATGVCQVFDWDDYPDPDPYVEILLETKSEWRYIGRLNLVKTTYGFWETHSDVWELYWEMGYGVLLYLLAAQYAELQGWELRSSAHRTDCADRLWESSRLRKAYHIEELENRYRFAGCKDNFDVVLRTVDFAREIVY